MRQRGGYARFMGCALVVGVILCLPIFGWSQAQPGQRLVLLTEEEAVELRLTSEQLESEARTRTKSLESLSGPRIVFQKPAIVDGIVKTTTPLDLFVALKPNPAPVDKTSLNVRARKGLFKKNLTGMVMPYVVPDGEGGWSFGIEAASIPHGNFRIEITVADQNGEQTVRTYYFQVSRRF